MRKTMFVFAVLLVCPWALATDVDIWCTANGDEVTVYYSASADANKPRGLGLNIYLDNAETISDVCALMPDPNGYWVFPGTIDINDLNFPSGTPKGDANDHSDTLDQPNAITVELGSLHYPPEVNSPNAPPASGALLKFTVSGNCTVTVAGNTARGNVVLYDAVEADTNLPSSCDVVLECFPACHPDYAEWVTVGKPTWWCNPRQCHAESDDATETIGKGTYWVGYNDLNVFIACWQDKLGLPASLPADYDHASEAIGKGTYRVGYADLDVFIANWQDKLGTPPNCLTCP